MSAYTMMERSFDSVEENHPQQDNDKQLVNVLQSHIKHQDKLLKKKSDEIERLTNIVKNFGQSFNENTPLGRLNDLVKSQTGEIARLRAIIQNGKNSDVVEGDYVTYDEFMRKLSFAYGRLHRSRIEFIHQSGNTSFGQVATGTFNSWRLDQMVPIGAYNAIDEMIFDKVVVNRAPTWTDDEYERLEIVLQLQAEAKAKGKKMNYNDIARELTGMFGRKITEDAVKSAIRRLRQQDTQEDVQEDVQEDIDNSNV